MSCGDPGQDSVRRDVVGYHSTAADHRAIADQHTGDNKCIVPDPDVIADTREWRPLEVRCCAEG